MENRLETIADNISDYAEKATAVCVITHSIFLLGLIVLTEDRVLFSAATVLEICRILIVAIVLLIVVIPEGLPLTISISMALSTNDMKNDHILIKNLESVQTCAMLHDICVSKTGTLTKGDLKVVKYQLCDNYSCHEKCTEAYFNQRLRIPDDIKDYVRESICANNDIRIEHDDRTYEYVPRGQKLEEGLVRFLADIGVDVTQAFKERDSEQVKLLSLDCGSFDQSPESSNQDRKQHYRRKVVIREAPAKKNCDVQRDAGKKKELARIYVKGAPEEVIELCSQMMTERGEQREMREDDKATILNHVVS